MQTVFIISFLTSFVPGIITCEQFVLVRKVRCCCCQFAKQLTISFPVLLSRFPTVIIEAFQTFFLTFRRSFSLFLCSFLHFNLLFFSLYHVHRCLDLVVLVSCVMLAVNLPPTKLSAHSTALYAPDQLAVCTLFLLFDSICLFDSFLKNPTLVGVPGRCLLCIVYLCNTHPLPRRRQWAYTCLCLFACA